MRVLLCWAVLICAMPDQAEVPSKPGVDAPELAFAGPSPVGYRTVTFTHKDQPDVENADGYDAPVVLRDRMLPVSIWYPAEAPKAGTDWLGEAKALEMMRKALPAPAWPLLLVPVPVV